MLSLTEILNQKENKPKEQTKQPQELFMSMSLIKDMTDNQGNAIEHCPKKIYNDFFSSDKIKLEKEVFNIGKFGEYLLLGGSAKGEQVTSLPRSKKDGVSMLTTESNIRSMVDIAEKTVIVKHQIRILKLVNTQVPIICKVDGYDNVYLRTELDLFPTTFIPNPHKSEKQGCIACIDVKYSSKYKGYGAYNWEQFEHMDHCQPDSIFYLLERYDRDLCIKFNPEYNLKVGYDNIITPYIQQFMKDGVKFFYMVIFYNDGIDEKNIRFFERKKHEDNTKTYNLRQREFHQRMVSCIETIKNYFERGFIAIPYNDTYRYRGCKYCPLNKLHGGDCEESQTIQSV